MESNLRLYVYNIEDCYTMIENLSQSLAKKAKKGIELDMDKLANSSIVGAIIRVAKKEMARLGERIKPTKEDVKEMRIDIAQYILNDCVPYL